MTLIRDQREIEIFCNIKDSESKESSECLSDIITQLSKELGNWVDYEVDPPTPTLSEGGWNKNATDR